MIPPILVVSSFTSWQLFFIRGRQKQMPTAVITCIISHLLIWGDELRSHESNRNVSSFDFTVIFKTQSTDRHRGKDAREFGFFEVFRAPVCAHLKCISRARPTDARSNETPSLSLSLVYFTVVSQFTQKSFNGACDLHYMCSNQLVPCSFLSSIPTADANA